jgi:uncharacterized delta-60 repeat protein
MKNIFTILLIVVLPVLLFAQPDTLWTRTFGGGSCYSVQQTTDGGYVLAGYTSSFSTARDFKLVKTNANGDSIWSSTFGGSNNESCHSVQETIDGGYILGGERESVAYGDYDYWLVKTNANGDSLWSRSYGGSDDDHCWCVRQTSDGGYILAGYTDSFGDDDAWLLKTNANGDSLWSRTFGGEDYEECMSVQQTTDGGYILAGSTMSSGAGASDFWLVKTNLNGYSLWSRTFGGSNYEWCNSVQQTADGGYILGGATMSFGSGDTDFWLVKTNINGDSLWSRTFGGSREDECYSVQQTSDGGYILGGVTESYGAGGADFWLVKTDANGIENWNRTFGGYMDDYCRSAQQTTDGGYVLAGTKGGSAFWLVRIESELPTELNASVLPSEYTLHSNYPNPFNSVTTIRYDVPRTAPIQLTIFNLLGQEVITLVDKKQLAGTYAISWNAADLPSGIYLCRMKTPEFTQTRKLVLVK